MQILWFLIGFHFSFFPSVKSNDKKQNTLANKSVKTRTTKPIKFKSSSVGKQHQNGKKPGTCNTPMCQKMAADLRKYINPNVDPCQDFHAYVCTNWKKIHKIPDKKPSWRVADILNEKVNHDIQEILNQSTPPRHSNDGSNPHPEDIKLFKKIKTFLAACKENKKRNSDVQGILAGFKHAFQKAIDRTTLTNVLLELNQFLVPGLFMLLIAPNFSNSNEFALYLSPAGIWQHSSKHFQNQEFVQEYGKAIHSLLHNLMGENFAKDDKLFKSQHGITIAEGIRDFEAQLAKITPNGYDKDPFQKPKPKQMSIQELEQMTQLVDWNSFFKGMLKLFQISTPIKFVVVDADAAEYFKKLDKVIQSTNPLILNYFFRWKVIQQYVANLEERSTQGYNQFNLKHTGIDIDSFDVTEKCIQAVTVTFPYVIGRWFVLKRFSPKDRQNVLNMVKIIKNTFQRRLKAAEWLDASSKNEALKKLAAMDFKIGYPKNIFNVEQIGKVYQTLDINPSNHFKNKLKMTHLMTQQEWQKLMKKGDPDDWMGSSVTPQTVNAFYHPLKNSLIYPAAFLQTPIYHPSVPAYLNMGAVGSNIGHEITHGFDNNGRHFDSKGHAKDWWTPNIAKEFENRAQCFVKQYSAFSSNGPNGAKIPVNGKLTLGENIADNGGLRLSWETWKSNFNSLNNDALPGLTKFTPEQLFFISYATISCGSSTPEFDANMAIVDPHAPVHARINGVLQNTPEFAKAFNCPEKSPMNPSQKCVLW